MEAPQPPARVTIFGLPYSVVGEEEAARYIVDCVAAEHGGVMLAANTDVLRRCRQDPELLDLFVKADVVTCDGMPIMWASKLQGQPLKERLPTSNLIHTSTQAAAASGVSVYLLGGNEGVAEKAAAAYQKAMPELKVAGFYCPPFGFEKNPEEMERIRATLKEAKPDLVYVGLGVPKQERLIYALVPDFPKTWFMATGISFSYVAGELKQAPRWLQRLGLEWFFRLCQEPKRLFRRYIIDDLPFLFPLFGSALKGRRLRSQKP